MKLCACGCGRETNVARSDRWYNGVLAYRKGEPQRFVKGHSPRVKVLTSKYRQASGTTLHRIRAERALGKPLPPGAVVHHADGTRSDDGPLVICQDGNYHKDLHVRMRVKAAGGNPWTDKLCTDCHQPKNKEQYFSRNRDTGDGFCPQCKLCAAKRHKRWRTARSA